MPRLRISPWLPVFLCALWRLDADRLFFPFLTAAALHEAGHILALLLCGGKITSLSISCTGAVITTGPLSARCEALSAAAGPLVSGLLVLSPWPWLRFWGAVQALVNLLPMFPLDGGRVLLAVLTPILTPQRAEAVIRASSLLTAALLAGALFAAVLLHFCC